MTPLASILLVIGKRCESFTCEFFRPKSAFVIKQDFVGSVKLPNLCIKDIVVIYDLIVLLAKCLSCRCAMNRAILREGIGKAVVACMLLVKNNWK